MMSYGPSLPAVYQRFATLVDKIVLKGDKPGNLPIEVPTRFTRSSTSRPPTPSVSISLKRS